MIVRERPAASAAEGALVLFHGRGADEHDLFPLLDELDPEQRLHGYTPRGPLHLPPGGAHWYVVRQVGFPDPATFSASYDAVADWLDTLPYARVVLGGFSQGAVMAYSLGLGRGRPRPDAILAFSGFVPEVDGFALELEPPLPPVTIAHGSLDPVIPVAVRPRRTRPPQRRRRRRRLPRVADSAHDRPAGGRGGARADVVGARCYRCLSMVSAPWLSPTRSKPFRS